MFGGADPPGADRIPSDIEILGNWFYKPEAWREGDAAFEGTAWTVKNLFELKNARRVRIAGNVFEKHWVQAQNGFAILFTVRNQEGTAPWSVVEDVAFTNNVLRHTASGVNVLGRDNNAPAGSARTSRILIDNNLFVDVGAPRWGGGGVLFQLLDGTDDVVITGNTALHAHSILVADGAPHRGFVFADNIVMHNEYGIIGTGTGPGRPTLARYFPSGRLEANVIVGGHAASYPKGNFFPSSLEQVGFADRRAGSLELAATSPFHGRSSAGRDPGVDMRRLAPALAATRKNAERSADGRTNASLRP
jgi:hypothetical protein